MRDTYSNEVLYNYEYIQEREKYIQAILYENVERVVGLTALSVCVCLIHRSKICALLTRPGIIYMYAYTVVVFVFNV